jgi:hypothetical protein
MASKTRAQRRWEKRESAIKRGDLTLKPRNFVVLDMIQNCKARTFEDRKKALSKGACRKRVTED